MKKTYIISAIISAILLATSAFPASAAGKVDCKMCHSGKAEGKTLHPAVSFGCDSCHTGVDASDVPHKFKGDKGLSEKGNALCLTCHDSAKFDKKTKHAALDMGCTYCHNPHSSENSRLLTSPEPDLCKGCHDASMFEKKTRHAALDMGCTSCHNPHSSDMDKLLNSKSPELCYMCHNETLFYGPTIHAPVGQGECLECHTPHSSENDTLTTAPTEKLCFTCHSDYSAKGKGSTHKPVTEGQCLECHLPHISNNEKLLFRQGNLICRKCHAEIEKNPHTVAGFSTPGHPVSARRDLARPGKIHSCESCHLPHKSDNPYLFRYKGKTAFDLCNNCHTSKY